MLLRHMIVAAVWIGGFLTAAAAVNASRGWAVPAGGLLALAALGTSP